MVDWHGLCFGYHSEDQEGCQPDIDAAIIWMKTFLNYLNTSGLSFWIFLMFCDFYGLVEYKLPGLRLGLRK